MGLQLLLGIPRSVCRGSALWEKHIVKEPWGETGGTFVSNTADAPGSLRSSPDIQSHRRNEFDSSYCCQWPPWPFTPGTSWVLPFSPTWSTFSSDLLAQDPCLTSPFGSASPVGLSPACPSSTLLECSPPLPDPLLSESICHALVAGMPIGIEKASVLLTQTQR